MAGFWVLRRVLGMEAGQSKLLRVLGIVGIVAFIGFFILRYQQILLIMQNPGDFMYAFVNDPIEFTYLMILWLLLGGPVGGA